MNNKELTELKIEQPDNMEAIEHAFDEVIKDLILLREHVTGFEDARKYDPKHTAGTVPFETTPSNDEIKREALKVTGETSDGYHTFNELYAFRKVFNAGLFNEWSEKGLYKVHKSKKHSDGEECFGGGWFIVTATLPTGQISNHYELGDWDLFQCEEREKADVWDGHTPQDVLTRLTAYLTQKENNE